MSWWSWAIVGYAGSVLLLIMGCAAICGFVGLSSRLRARRLVSDAERFLARVALAAEGAL